MIRVRSHREATSVGRRLLWVLLATAVLASCGKNQAASLGEGRPVTFEVAGLRSIIERHAAFAGDRLLVAGRAGRDLHGRMIWSGADGTVLQDVELNAIPRPDQVTACIEGTNADIYWITQDADEYHLYMGHIRDDQLIDDVATLAPTASSAQGWTVEAVTGLTDGCGVCLYDPTAGELTCRLGLEPAERRTWRTGPLGEWSVLQLGEALVVADWSADDEGWMTVRITPLTDTHPVEVGWLHSYVIGQLPKITDPAERPLAHPSFLPGSDNVKVVFVDGTDWFTRLFVQRFPMDNMIPSPPDLVESCRGTCKLHWVGDYDGFGWIWYEDQVGNWAVRIADDGERARAAFTPPPNVQALAGGWFKMGLGNDVANWWALISYEPTGEEEE